MSTKMKIMSAALLAGLAGQSSAQALSNGSFEFAGLGANDIFLDWLNFNAPVEPDLTELILDGAVSAKMFGANGADANGNFNVTNVGVLFQTQGGVTAGDEWEVKANVGQITGDELEPGAEAFMALVYIVPGDGNVVDFQEIGLEAGDPVDTFQEVTVSAVAPLDVEEIQVLFGFLQPEATEDTNGDGMVDGNDAAGGAAHWDLASIELLSTGNEIPFFGGGFEEVPPFAQPYFGHRDFGNAINNCQRLNAADAGTLPPFDGEFVGSIFGQFNGAANDSGFFQDLPASEGQMWEASAQVGHASTDALGVGNEASLSLQFLDAAGNILSDDNVPALDSSSPTDMWNAISSSAMAPAGTDRARLTFVFSQPEDMGAGQPAGAVRIDAVNLSMGGAPTRLCADQNGDGMVNGLDFGAWLGNFNANNPLADVNQDMMVNGLDFGAWLGAFNAGAAGPVCP